MKRFVLLFVVTVFVSQLSFDVAFAGNSELSQSFKTFFRPLLHARQKRQATNACLDDLRKFQGDQVQKCLRMFGESTSLSSLSKYCSDGCSNTLLPVLEALLKDCGASAGSVISQAQLDFLKDGCLQNAKHVYCIVAVFNVTNFYSAGSAYQNCIAAGATTCTSDCRTVVQTILSITGCCEYELERILDQANPTQKRTLDSLFTACHVTKPAHCTSSKE